MKTENSEIVCNGVVLEHAGNGYYSVKNKPTDKELREYYENKYYQAAEGSYSHEYGSEEREYLRHCCRQLEWILQNLPSPYNKGEARESILDVGCGEGWALDYFREKGYAVKGFDFSDHGIKKFNSRCLPVFTKGNIYELLEADIKNGQAYDVVLLDNVLEHVLDPEHLLARLEGLLKANGVVCVQVPNDFSATQSALIEGGFAGGEFWVDDIAHLSYFNTGSLKKTAKSCGWRVLRVISDYPIDFHLFNEDTDYLRNPSRGRGCHLTRVRVENLMCRIDLARRCQIGEIMAEMGIGRVITAFLAKDVEG